MNLKQDAVKIHVINLDNQGMSASQIADITNLGKSTITDFLRKETWQQWWNDYERIVCKPDVDDLKKHLPKVLLLDIETAPLEGYIWGLWNQNLSLDMIKSEWFILSYAAKWLGASERDIYYNDMRGRVDTEDDKFLLEELWNLLNDADIVITQNGVKFDIKKINARFIMNGFQPPSSFKHIDTLVIAKQNFGFTSNKLEWMSDKLNVKFKKLSHGTYPGFKLWKAMKADEFGAWLECEEYNKHDVLSLEELYIKLSAWDNKHPNFSLYFDEPEQRCRCGHNDWKEDGYAYTQLSKFQRYRCNHCGAEMRSRKNLFTKEKRESLLMNIA